MCAALLAEWWRGEYSNSIVYVVIDETVQSPRCGRARWTIVGICRQQLFVVARCFDARPRVACRFAERGGRCVVGG